VFIVILILSIDVCIVSKWRSLMALAGQRLMPAGPVNFRPSLKFLPPFQNTKVCSWWMKTNLPTLVLIGLMSVLAQTRGEADSGPRAIDVEGLRRKYDANSRHEAPIAAYSMGTLQIGVWRDGRILFQDPNGKGKSAPISEGHLSERQVTRLIESLHSIEGFWKLEAQYNDPIGYYITQVRSIRLQLPGAETKEVTVYGPLKEGSIGDLEPKNQRLVFQDYNPPDAFLDVIQVLRAIPAVQMKPYDPGYVLVSFVDRSREQRTARSWPGQWPASRGPLCVENNGEGVNRRVEIIFPSDQLPELRGYLWLSDQKQLVMVDGWKTQCWFRWDLPGAKKWE